MTNAESEFKKIDINNGGFILFDEFADYSIRKSLDIYTPLKVKFIIRKMLRIKKTLKGI